MVPPEILQRFDVNGPRYTSYPTADRFTAAFGGDAYATALREMPRRAVSLYVHVPFCRSLCYYCACNKIVTKSASAANDYLSVLEKEIALVSAQVPLLPVLQLALGGGTPNFLSISQLTRLINALSTAFSMRADREQSIELDPRYLDEAYVRALPELGFNRVSLGVQDFNEGVQALIHRFQSFEQTARAVRAARHSAFGSISFDLVYGLPLQSRQSFAATLERTLSLEPDRVALFNYAHIPERFKAQRRIPTDTLPSIETRTELFLYATERLVDAGYRAIGLDHFAKPGDPLAKAHAEGSLRRNFQGYSPHQSADLIGLGVSAISNINSTFSQNSAQLELYVQSIRAGKFATTRGVALTTDDRIRAAVIEKIMCTGRVDWADLAARYQIEPAQYFAREQRELAQLNAAQIIAHDDNALVVTPRGHLLLRVVAMVFDAYKNATREQTVAFSRVA